MLRGRFGVSDVAQQVVGGFLLAGPFVVTEEVWDLAASMSWLQTGITVFMVLAIGYGALYRADRTRDPEAEEDIGGVPLRFISLVVISYAAVFILAYTLAAPETFDASWVTTAKAVSIGSIFSVVGAATADHVF